MDNISFDLYKLFYTVASIGNISKAAESLYISQPAVTQGIHKLEEQLSGTLFYRVPKGVILTEEGKKLYDYIKESIETMENAERKFSQYINLEEGTIRIGCGNTLGMSILYKAILEFSKMFPKINIEISSDLTSESIDYLSKGKLDMVIFKMTDYDFPSNIEIIEGKEDELCLFASKKYLKEHNIKKYEDLKKCTMILTNKNSSTGKNVNQFFRDNNIDLSANYIVSSSDARKYFALNDMGVTIGHKSLIEKELEDGSLVKLNLKPSLPRVKIGVAILKDNISSFATLKLLDFIKDEIGE